MSGETLTPPKYIAKLRAEDVQTVYLVMDQNGLNITVYFAHLDDAQAFAERGRTPPDPPNPRWLAINFIVVPVPVWPSLAARDATDDEGVG